MARNFRSTYLSKIGFDDFRAREMLREELSADVIDLKRLAKLWLRTSVSSVADRLHTWKYLLGIIPNTGMVVEEVSKELREHYEDLRRAALLLSAPARQTADHCFAVMAFIYLFHDHNYRLAPVSLEETRGLGTLVRSVATEDVDRFWILAAVLDGLWLGQERRPYLDTCVAIMRRDTSATLRSALESNAELRACIRSRCERWMLNVFALALHPETALRVLDMVIAGCPLIMAYMAATLMKHCVIRLGSSLDVGMETFTLAGDANTSLSMLNAALELWRSDGAHFRPKPIVSLVAKDVQASSG